MPSIPDEEMEYALENTHVLYEPARRIDTFGDTRFDFVLLSEPMDAVGVCRVRSGHVEAQRPKIIRPEAYRDLEVEGFGAHGRQFFDWLKARGAKLQMLLQYGFRFSRSDVQEGLLHENIADVRGRVVDEALHSGNALRVVLEGVDDDWEICLLKFTLEMVQKSHEINIFDFRRKGLL